ncbi:Rab interactor-like protein, partial [Dissostichus eleginoides]
MHRKEHSGQTFEEEPHGAVRWSQNSVARQLEEASDIGEFGGAEGEQPFGANGFNPSLDEAA